MRKESKKQRKARKRGSREDKAGDALYHKMGTQILRDGLEVGEWDVKGDEHT